jgi:hypothetical protein
MHHIWYSVLVLKLVCFSTNGELLSWWLPYSCNVRALASTYSLLVLILSCIRDIAFYYHCLLIICYSIPENYMQFLKNESFYKFHFFSKTLHFPKTSCFSKNFMLFQKLHTFFLKLSGFFKSLGISQNFANFLHEI